MESTFTCNGCGHHPTPETGLPRLVGKNRVEFKCPGCGRTTRLELEYGALEPPQKEDGKRRH